MDELHNDLALEKEARSQYTSGERLEELAVLNDDLAEIVADNVSAPPELLEDLAEHESKAVRKAVTSNPNTPTETLFQLGEQFPQELLDNPVFNLLILEDLKILNNIQEHLLIILIQQQKAPKFILDYAAIHRKQLIQNIAELHVTWSAEMQKEWHEAAANMIKEVPLEYDCLTYDNSNTSLFLLTNLVEVIPFNILENLDFKKDMGRNPNTPSIWLKRLASDLDLDVRSSVAENPNAPLDILQLLSRDHFLGGNYTTNPDTSKGEKIHPNAKIKLGKNGFYCTLPRNFLVRMYVADNPNTSAEILKYLANDLSPAVRRCVAKNLNTPISELILLANDLSYEVRMSVAENIHTPLNQLKLLIEDDDFIVGHYAAQNPNISSEILESISDTSIHSEYKHQYVAENIHTPTDILELFATNQDPLIRNKVAKNTSTPINVLGLLATDSTHPDPYSYICRSLAENCNLPVKILELISTNKDVTVRENVANHPQATPDMLELLAKDSSNRVRQCIARSLNTPLFILERLADDPDISVRCRVARNPNSPFQILKKLANDHHNLVRESVAANYQCTHEIKETIFKSFSKLEQPSFSRLAFLFSNYAESTVLAENSNSISWLERYAIAQNQKTPKETLKQLAQDGNRIVRATAKESLGKYY